MSLLFTPTQRERSLSGAVLFVLFACTLPLSLLSLSACDDDGKANTDLTPVAGTAETPPTAGMTPVVSTSGLAVTSPAQGAYLASRMVEVTGTHPTALSVTVNGQEVSVSGQRFATTLTLDEGAQVITVSDSSSEVEVNVMVDLTPPLLEIGTPAYGTHVDSNLQSSVTVTGGASDALSGVDLVNINGVEVPVDPNGAFQFTYVPEVGLNLVEVTLQDLAGNSVKAYRSFLYGRFKEWSTPVNRALGAFATPYALDALERAIVAAVGGGLIDSLVNSSVAQEQGVSIDAVEYSEMRVNLEPLEGYIEVTIVFNDLRVRFTLDSPSTSGDIYVNPELSAKLYLEALPSGSLDVRVEDPQVSLSNFDLYVDSALIGAVTTFLESFIADFAEEALLSILTDQLVGSLVDPELFRPTLSVLNTELQLQLLVEQAEVTPMGVDLRAGLALAARDAVRQAPGYLFDRTPSEPERLSTMVSAFAQLNSLHMLLGQLWRGGLLDLNLLDLVNEPPAPLRAAALAGFTGGELLNRMSATEAVGVRLRPSLPPVARFEPVSDPSAVFVDFNDLLIDLTLPSGEAWVTLALNLTAKTTPSIVANDLQLPTELSVTAWAVATPLFEVDTERLLNVLVPLLERLPSLVGVEAGGEPLIRFSELGLFGVQVSTTDLKTTEPPSPHALIGLQVFAP